MDDDNIDQLAQAGKLTTREAFVAAAYSGALVFVVALFVPTVVVWVILILASLVQFSPRLILALFAAEAMIGALVAMAILQWKRTRSTKR